MNRPRKFATLTAVIAAGLLTITSSAVGTASATPLSPDTGGPENETRVSEVYPGCEVFFDTPRVVDGKVRFTGGAKCSDSAPAEVQWLVIWLEPDNNAPYDEWFGERTGSAKSHSASSTVPCVSGHYQGTLFASVYGNKGVDQIWVDREATITC
ncbi:hypothetical protein [Spongiactinospora sp. 9N601]|uniref:hypothetical protein n=1 Tax=Spongiactinospora sp. 9N601 TaxID=3375149 RepID=UPI0037AC1B52